jgi:glycosyltransferase involved in cell wall biosynthesis
MPKKIAIFADQFVNWAGGTDFLFDLINNLPKKNIYYILLKKKNEFRNLIKNIIYFFFKSKRENIYIKKENFSLIKKIENKYIKILEIDYANATSFSKKENCNYFFFYLFEKTNKKIKSLGYIADLQHKYLSGLFKKWQINYRDEVNRKILINSKIIIVNSRQTKKDILKFYKFAKKKNIINIPFLPTINKNFLNCDINVLKKFEINKKYFIVSNQFWLHKNHKIVFRAFSIFLKKNPQIMLICTGSTLDHRNKYYFGEVLKLIKSLNIECSIKILNYIKKNEQISLIRKSIAVIQPTSFEGGPGGGSVKDAIALGVPTIISDISVNKEIKYKKNFFFRTNDYFDLSLKMENILKYKFKILNNKEIIFKSNLNEFKKRIFFNKIINDL